MKLLQIKDICNKNGCNQVAKIAVTEHLMAG